MLYTLLLPATLLLAYSNGANDNFKGVASLYGSGAATYRTALAWASLTTLAGAGASVFFAQTLLKRFSGKGLVPDALVTSPHFLLAVVLGASLTVLLATRTGFPVSTTHGLTGALIGAGLTGPGSAVNFAALQKSFLLPLLLSPVLAIAVGALLYLLLRGVRRRTGITKEWCLCLGTEERIIANPRGSGALGMEALPPGLSIAVASATTCRERYAGSFLGVRAQNIMDAAHFVGAGAVCFARALNDTPKIVAMLLLVPQVHLGFAFCAVGVAMVIGGVLHSARIAETMSKKITTLGAGQGLSASLCTAALVVFASVSGLPVSTTHVTVGALFGIGLTSGEANVSVMRNIALSWVLTLPCAAILAGAAHAAISRCP